MLELMAKEREAKFFVPPMELCADNGVMIAWTGLLMHKHGVKHSLVQTQVRQRFRMDEVDVVWR
jgi:tRNA A37 threonylcarbamoyltransferase TsaD